MSDDEKVMTSVENPSTKVIAEKQGPVRESATWISRAAAVFVALIVALQQFGILTPKQSEDAQKAVQQGKDIAEQIEQQLAPLIEQNKQLTAENRALVAEKVEVKPRELIIDWDVILKPLIDKLIDKIPSIIDKITPKPKPPEPQPVPPTPQPNPQPPTPQPQPPNPIPPTPGTLRLRLTDASGQEITSATVNAGKLILVRLMGATGATNLTALAHGAAQVAKLDDAACAIVLELGSEVDVVGTDYGSQKQVSMRITANKGPMPPPVVVVDPPTPRPVSDDLKVVVIYESSQTHSAAQDAVLNSTRLFSTLDSRCSKGSDGRSNWRKWDKDLEVDPNSTMGELFAKVLPKAKAAGLPVIAVGCGDDVTVYPITANADVAQVESVLSCGNTAIRQVWGSLP